MANQRGFIIDAPNALVEPFDGGDIVHILTATTGEVTFAGESIDITGGWGYYPLASIPTTRTITVNITDAEWDLQYLRMVTGGTVATGTDEFTHFGDRYTIDSDDYTITIPKVVIPGSVKIAGYTETTEATPTTGKFKVTVGTTDTTILFAAADAGKVVMPSYRVSVTNAISLATKTTDFPKTAAVTLMFPIYESEGDDTAITGYGELILYKARIMADFTIGGGAKSAYAPSVQFTSLDPKRPDKNMFKFIYNPVAD